MDIVPAVGGGLEGTVLTLSGPVEAEGGLELLGRDYSVDILVGSQGSLDSQVERALSLIATPEERRYQDCTGRRVSGLVQFYGPRDLGSGEDLRIIFGSTVTT